MVLFQKFDRKTAGRQIKKHCRTEVGQLLTRNGESLPNPAKSYGLFAVSLSL
jgi:hypothetical protein